MRKFERIIGFIFLIGLIFKFFLIAGGSLFLTFSLMILAFLYFYLGFALFNQIPLKKIFKKESYSGTNKIKIIISIGFGAGLSNTCMGILYKIQHWTGSRILLISGMAIIIIIILIGLISINKTKGTFVRGIITRSIIIGGFGFLLLFTSDYSLIRIQYRNHPSYIKAYKDLKSDPKNLDYKKNLIKEQERISLPEEVFKHKYNEDK